MDRKHCRGCRDNFYNGNNDLGVSECWMLKDAKREKRIRIPTDMRPPYKGLPVVQMPTCYHEKGYVLVKPEALDSRGYWRR
jgi:hypothetical protein